MKNEFIPYAAKVNEKLIEVLNRNYQTIFTIVFNKEVKDIKKALESLNIFINYKSDLNIYYLYNDETKGVYMKTISKFIKSLK